MFDANEYQRLAERTLIAETELPSLIPQDLRLIWGAIGLVGEAGEFSECVKKQVLHGHGLDRDMLIKELGDVAWYLAALCTVLDVPLSTVLETNITKLQARYPQGWDQQRSKHGGAT